MLSNQINNTEYKIYECFLISNYEFEKISEIMSVQKIQSPLRISLFQQQNQTIEDIKQIIFIGVENAFYHKIKMFLADLYLNGYEQLSQCENTSLNKENLFILFLLSLKVEIDVPSCSISNFIVPIAFKELLKRQEEISYQQRQKIYQLVYEKICIDFKVQPGNNDSSQNFMSWYKLLIYLSEQPMNHQNLNYQNQIINYVHSIDNKYEENKKLANNQDMCGSQDVNNKSHDRQKGQTLKQQLKQQDLNQKQTSNLQLSRVKFGKSLIKQQNQEIIISRSSNSMIPLGKDNIIYYNKKIDVRLSNSYNQRILYTGELDYNHEQQGNGTFQQINEKVSYEGQFDQGLQSGQGKQIFIKEQYEGSFRQGQKQGFIIITDLQSQKKAYATYKYDTLYEYFQDKHKFAGQQQQKKQIEQLIEREIVESKNNVLSVRSLKTLNIGQCLQEKVIDYYLEEIENHYKQFHKENIDYILFNILDSKDVFSLPLDYKTFDFNSLKDIINLTLLEQLLQTKEINKKQQDLRQIFVFPLSRSHLVIELSRIYIIDTLQTELVQLCEILKQAYKQIGINLDYDSKDYNCGVNTCYVIHELIKNYKVPLKHIKFNNTTEVRESYARYMKNLILTRNCIHINK